MKNQPHLEILSGVVHISSSPQIILTGTSAYTLLNLSYIFLTSFSVVPQAPVRFMYWSSCLPSAITFHKWAKNGNRGLQTVGNQSGSPFSGVLVKGPHQSCRSGDFGLRTLTFLNQCLQNTSWRATREIRKLKGCSRYPTAILTYICKQLWAERNEMTV